MAHSIHNCADMKPFLVKGDPLYTMDVYWCFEHEIAWGVSEGTPDVSDGHEVRFEVLMDSGYWHHGVIENDYPEAAFLDGKRSFAEWVRGLSEPVWAVSAM